MSFNTPIISVQELSKSYHIYKTPVDRLKQYIFPRLQYFLRRPIRSYFHEFWALKNISFEIEKAETVGIIGRNGSGKSTLLQLICGTLTPTSGSISVSGRLAALLELGSGFNPEFTGIENIYLNGTLLGLSRDEIDNKFDAIAAFADIGDFISQPVKMYSSGMFVRLAFAINIMSEPDILIVDEALAVGDMNFQAKCMTALKRKQDNGTTILFVSHDIGSIKSLCSRGIYLEHGELKQIGVAGNVVEHYIRVMREEMNEEQRMASESHSKGEATPSINKTQTAISTQDSNYIIEPSRTREFEQRVSFFRYGSGEARIIYVELLDEENQPLTIVDFNQYVTIRIYVEVYEAKTLNVLFNVRDDKKNQITGSNLLLAGHPLLNAQPGEFFCIEYSLSLPLQEGLYSIQVALNEPIVIDQTANFIDFVEDAVVFTVSKWDKARVFSKVYLFPTVDSKKLCN